MIGVVLWSSLPRQNAVIWCEDQGELAYLRCRSEYHGAEWPEPGQIVDLTTEREGLLRIARRVQATSGRCDLRSHLTRTASPSQPSLRLVSSQVLPACDSGDTDDFAAQERLAVG